jgi:hypothetical protein
MVCPSGDLLTAVLLVCSAYAPLQEDALDLDIELLTPSEGGATMLSILGYR